jgi:hypothetical protein
MLDRTHHPQLPAAEAIRVLPAVDGSGLAEDVRHFEPRHGHCRTQKCAGGGGAGGAGSILGSKSKGLVVAYTVLVATFR